MFYIVTYFKRKTYFGHLNILDGRGELRTMKSFIDPALANVNRGQKTPH